MLVIMFRNGFRRLWGGCEKMVLELTRNARQLKTALSDGKLDAKNGMVSCKDCGWADIISFLASDLAANFLGFQENKVDFGKWST